MEGKNLQENENERRSSNQELNNPEENNRMNEVLMAVMSDHKDRVNQMGSLMEKDIPQLCEDWKRSCKDITRCPDSLKNKLSEKIKCYTCTEWWEPTQAEQAALLLCIRKKNNTLRTVIDGQQQNDNTVKDVTCLPDQDIIRLDIARVKICSKIDLSDAYKKYVSYQKMCIKRHSQ